MVLTIASACVCICYVGIGYLHNTYISTVFSAGDVMSRRTPKRNFQSINYIVLILSGRLYRSPFETYKIRMEVYNIIGCYPAIEVDLSTDYS